MTRERRCGLHGRNRRVDCQRIPYAPRYLIMGNQYDAPRYEQEMQAVPAALVARQHRELMLVMRRLTDRPVARPPDDTSPAGLAP